MNLKTSLLIATTLILLTACGKTPEVAPANTQTPGTPTAMDMNANAPTVEQSLEKVGDTIVNNQTFRGCISRSIPFCTSEIISQYATGESVDVCKNFKDEALVTTCTSAVTTEIARKKADPSLCSALTDSSKSLCIEQAITAKALKASDIALCGEIELPTPTKIDSTTPTMPLMPYAESARDRCRQQIIRSSPVTDTAEKLCATLEFEPSRTMCTQDMGRRREMEKQMKKAAGAPAPTTPAPVAPAVAK
jgi:hypothetical protein